MGRREKWRKKAQEFFPWEDEIKKKKPERMDSIPPKTSLRAKIRSKPKIPGQEYLDMYLLMKEKERWEKYGITLAKVQDRAGGTWRDMRKELIKAKKTLPEHPEGVMRNEPEAKALVKAEEDSKKLPRGMKVVDFSY